VAAAVPCLPDCVLDSAEAAGKVQDACGIYSDNIADRDERRAKCGERCQKEAEKPYLAGHCEWTRDCLADCRAESAVATREINTNLRRRIRTACRDVVPKCSIGKGLARRTCESASPPASSPAAIADTSNAPVAADPVPQQTEDEGECSRSCVNHTLRDCFGQCFGACEGNPRALQFCRTACRNRHCELIVLVCGCEADVDCASYPVTTTTSSTTTTIVSTTTTTLFL
jgi:hypothetical protein